MISDRYVAIRDDSGPKSLSLNERDFLKGQCISAQKSVFRVDGRRHCDVRKVRIELSRWDNGSSCTLQWGVGTRVTALCSAELVPPPPEHPNEGMVDFLVDISPMAGTSFRQANPVGTSTHSSFQTTRGGPNFSDNNQRLLSNRILRCVERVILVGGALDTEALVLMPGKWVWRFTVALTVLDDGGNCVDACTMAAISALRHYRKPKVEFSGSEQEQAGALPVMIPSTLKEATPLPLHHTPLSITFALITTDETTASTSPTAMVDPTDREEQCQFGSLTIATNIHSELCLLDYGGGCELLPSQLKACWEIGENAAKSLCNQIEDALEKADEQARKEKLEILQGRPIGNTDTMHGAENVSSPYSVGVDGDDEVLEMEPEVDNTQNEIAQSQAEEAYREQALDFNQGHVANIVREDVVDDSKDTLIGGAGSLLSTMLKSASRGSKADDRDDSSHCQSLGGESKAHPITRPEAQSAKDNLATPSINENVKDTSFANSEEATTDVVSTTSTSAPSKRDAMDEDDEEEPVQLRSEFDEQPKPAPASKTPVEENATDLSMAIKKKKKKAKSKKK